MEEYNDKNFTKKMKRKKLKNSIDFEKKKIEKKKNFNLNCNRELMEKLNIFLMKTFVFDDGAYAVVESLELRIGRSLVVDELDFDRFHRRHGEDGLGHSGTQSAQQTLSGRQIAVGVHRTFLELFKSTESISFVYFLIIKQENSNLN